jgi:hypothetical protein
VLFKLRDFLSFLCSNNSTGAKNGSLLRFPDHTQLVKHTHTHTHTAGSIPLNEGSARRRGRYLHSTQQAQDTNIHALSDIRTRDPSKQASAFVRLDRAAAEICLP